MTEEEHKERHKLLHRELDELTADFIMHTGRLPSETTLMEFLKWANEQRNNPTEV